MTETNTEKEFNKVQDIVEHLLKTDERCRNDDKWLIFKVMQRFTKIYIPFEDFKNLPSFGTITRVRRKIQNTEHRYMPTDPTILAKRIKRVGDVQSILGYGDRQ